MPTNPAKRSAAVGTVRHELVSVNGSSTCVHGQNGAAPPSSTQRPQCTAVPAGSVATNSLTSRVFADARLTADQDGNELPGTGRIERVREDEQLLGAADKGRQEIRGHHAERYRRSNCGAIAALPAGRSAGDLGGPPSEIPCRTPLFD